jgi:hypothetical protein
MTPPRRPHALLAVLLAIALLVPVAAFAAHPSSGKWKGKVKTNGVKVTFKVSKSKKRVKNFAVVQLSVFCFGGEGLTTRVFLVPSAKVKKSGKFKTVYHPKDESGQVLGNLELSGRFKTSKKASGKLNYTQEGCSSGPVKWSAKKKK